MSRSLSYSEISSAQTCEALARWDFQYGGHLAGGVCYKRRQLAAGLGNGRAWGAAVAAWHAYPTPENLMAIYQAGMARMGAHSALRGAYRADVAAQLEKGIWVPPETQADREQWLGQILDHYCSTAEPLPNLTKLEGELSIPIPSRTGRRGSSRYRFEGFIDGFTEDGDLEWIVEFKFRDQLTPLPLIELSRQIRWYAWSRQQETGRRVAGVIVDERLAEAPKPARLVKGKKKSEGLVPSHAKDQLCRPEDYVALCEEHDVEPKPEIIEALGARQWQQRHYIVFGPGELEESGKELVSAAKLIRDLDSGDRYPLRNAQAYICRGCKFKEICAHPTDRSFAATLYEERPPKRLRTRDLEEVAV